MPKGSRSQPSLMVLRALSAVVLAWTLGMGARAAVAIDFARAISFDIPPQALSSALVQFSDQAGVQFTAPGTSLSGLRSDGVRGKYPPAKALGILLHRTGLSYRIVDERTISIGRAGLAGAGTTSAAPGNPGEEGKTQSSGGFRLAPADQGQASGASVVSGSQSGVPSGVPPTTGGNSQSVLQEVVVSSRKMSESLLDVPQSVTAYSAHALQEFNIQSFTDYATMTPNLSFSYGSGMLGFVDSRSVAIRGIEGAGTTSLYIDDTPVPESIDPRVVDIERIEILEGPQGTLYGQSSLGGNIRLITVQPSFTDADAHFDSQAGWTDGGASPDYGGDFAGTLTVVPDRVAVRLVGFVDHEAGFLTRTFPTDDGAGPLGSDDNQGANLTYGGSLTVLTRITDNLDVTLRIMDQQTGYHGWPAIWAEPPQLTPISYDVSSTADVQPWSSDNWYLPSLEIMYRGTGWTLTSSTSYFSRKAEDVEDGTQGTDDVFADYYGLDLDPYNPVPWNGYYMDHRVVEETRAVIDPIHGFRAVVGVFASKVVDNGILNSHDIPGIEAAGLWPTDLAWYSQNENETRTNAVFGELYYDIANFEFTVGLRRYDLRENGLVFAEGALNGQVTNQTLEQTSQEGVSPKFAVSYKFTPDTMTYALASKGFRGGGAGGLLPPLCEPFPSGLNLTPNQPTTYGSDWVWNYEVGAKTAVLDDRVLLTASAFDMNWTDIQQAVTLPRCFITFITNAGAARAKGGEFEASGHPWQPLEIRVGVAYDNAVITDEGFSQQPVGSRVYQIPRWTWNVGGTYTQPLTQDLTGFATLSLSHVGDSVSGTLDSVGLTIPAYTILNGQMGVQWATNELALYAKNLTNKNADLGVLNPISYDPVNAEGIPTLRITLLPPLQIGLRYSHAF